MLISWTQDFTDSGYQVCERCGMHEYWHNKDVVLELFGKDSEESKKRGFFEYPFYSKFINSIFFRISCLKRVILSHKQILLWRIKNYTKPNEEQDLPF